MKDNNKPLFENILQYGNLYHEYTLVEGIDCLCPPMLEVLRNDKRDIFISVLSDCRKIWHFMILKMNIDQVIAVMKNEIELLDMFKSAEDIIDIIMSIDGTNIKSVKFSEISELDLPDHGQTMEFEDDEHDEYINALKNERN